MKNLKVFVIVIIVILGITILSVFLNKEDAITKSMPKKSFQVIDINAGENIYTYNSYIYTYGKAGVKIFKDEKLLLNDKFSIENPYVATNNDKFAITDKNSKVIRVYSSEGNMYIINSKFNILGFSINKIGSCAVILKNQDNYEIDVFDKSGKLIYSVKDINYLEGIPINVAISDNEEVLAVSYAKTQGASLDSNIVLYSIKDNKLFGGFIKNNQFVGIIKFLTNTNLIGISEKEIFIIKVPLKAGNKEEQPKEIYKNPLNNILRFVKFIDDKGYVICYGENTTNDKNTMKENEIIFYNTSGGVVGKYYNKDKVITNLWANKFGAVIGEGRNFIGLDTSGNKLWEYQATQDIKNVLFYDDKNSIAIETNNKIKIVKIDKILFDVQIDENSSETTTIEQNKETSTKYVKESTQTTTKSAKEKTETTTKQEQNKEATTNKQN